MVKVSLQPPDVSEEARKRARLERFAINAASAPAVRLEALPRDANGPSERSGPCDVSLKARSRSPRSVRKPRRQGKDELLNQALPLPRLTSSLSRQRTVGTALPPLHSIQQGRVVSVKTYGAFVQLGDGRIYKDGLLHRSRWPTSESRPSWSTTFVHQADLHEGDAVYVKVINYKEHDKFELDARFVSQTTGTGDDPEDRKRRDDAGSSRLTKVVCTPPFEKELDAYTLCVPAAEREPSRTTTRWYQSGSGVSESGPIPCSLGLRNRNNLMLRSCKSIFEVLDTSVYRWLGCCEPQESMTSNYIKSSIWSFLRNPSKVALAHGTKVISRSLQTGNIAEICSMDKATSVADMLALLKGPAFATVRAPYQLCRWNYVESSWFDRFHKMPPRRTLWWTLQPSNYEGLPDKIGISRFPNWIKKPAGSSRFPVGCAAISIKFGWAAFMDPDPILKIFNLVTGETLNEPCDPGQALYHLVAHGPILVYSQSGANGRGSTIKLMEIQLAPASLQILSSNQIRGPVCNLAVQGDLLALARAENGAELYHVSVRTGLADRPSHVLVGDFRDIALAQNLLITHAPGLVQVWSIQDPFHCLWRWENPSIWGIGTMLSEEIMRLQWLEQMRKRYRMLDGRSFDEGPAARKTLHSSCRTSCVRDIGSRLAKDFIDESPVRNNIGEHREEDCLQFDDGRFHDDSLVHRSSLDAALENSETGCIKFIDGQISHEEPAAHISPEEAARVQRAFWETSVLRFAQSGSVSSAFSVNEQPQVEKRIVLLSFNRRPAELQQAILSSPLALSLLDKGIDVRPTWAGGAIVLVEGLEPEALDDDLLSWNVAVHDSEEPSVFEAMQKLPYKIRPRLKPGAGRRFVPDAFEFFHVSDDEGYSPSVDAEDGKSRPLTDDEHLDLQSLDEPQEVEVSVVRTFVHVRMKQFRSARSLPNTV